MQLCAVPEPEESAQSKRSPYVMCCSATGCGLPFVPITGALVGTVPPLMVVASELVRVQSASQLVVELGST